jgi:hypothetical protein
LKCEWPNTAEHTPTIFISHLSSHENEHRSAINLSFTALAAQLAPAGQNSKVGGVKVIM